MLQALGYGIPVLVPDTGIIGYRTKKFNLGLTYTLNALEMQLLRFLKIPKETYKKSIDEYMKLQSVDRLKEVLINTFGGYKSTIIHH